MKPVVRFAPSPTGRLHIGNARTALINWLFARHYDGTMILRLDDTDLERSQEAYTQGIFEDLDWLGLTYDQYHVQSKRLDRYKKAVEKLKESGRLYPCYETPHEIDLKRKLQRSQGLPPLYDRAALHLSLADKQKLEAEGRTPHWRFLLDDKTISWKDLSRGELCFEHTTFSDPILIREDGSPVYTLSSVVDDIELGVTHILRGEDHISNTVVQIQLLDALGANAADFTFGHFPLLIGSEGESLSKRFGSLTLKSLREDGLESLAVCSYLMKLGTSEDITPALSLSQLVDHFDVGHFGRAAPRFSLEMLGRLNGRLLHHWSYDDVHSRLVQLGLDGFITPEFWGVVHGNLNKLSDLKHFYDICHKEINPVIDPENKDYLKTASALLPEKPWGIETWQDWTTLLRQKTTRRGKDLFMPLRLAITGEAHGPDMQSFFPLMDRDKVLQRLNGFKG